MAAPVHVLCLVTSTRPTCACYHPAPATTRLPRPPAVQALLRESQLAGERLQKEYNALAEKAARLHHTLEEHIHSNTQLLADNSQRQVEIKQKEDEIRALRVRRRPASAGLGVVTGCAWLCVVAGRRAGSIRSADGPAAGRQPSCVGRHVGTWEEEERPAFHLPALSLQR